MIIAVTAAATRRRQRQRRRIRCERVDWFLVTSLAANRSLPGTSVFVQRKKTTNGQCLAQPFSRMAQTSDGSC